MSDVSARPSWRVLVAPDSFKGSASAAEVARAVATGWSSVRPDDVLRLIPMADGGEGTLAAIDAALPGCRQVPVVVRGPEGGPLRAHWLLLPDGTGVVELANTSGLTLSPHRRPLTADSFGFGEAIRAALDAGVSKLLLAIGGSASTDGGVGALTALGARFLDVNGDPIRCGNLGLSDLSRVDLSGLRALPAAGAVVLSDVTNPLVGPLGAAAVFGPQKGAGADDIAVLDSNLRRLADHLHADPTTPGAGAAGGTGFGLLAWGATLVAGSRTLGALLAMPEAIRESDAVITGEGQFDHQSTSGKVVGYVCELAASSRTRALLVAGRVAAPTAGLFDAATALVDLAGPEGDPIAQPLAYLRDAGAALARSTLSAVPPSP
jgi:glycerate kinase